MNTKPAAVYRVGDTARFRRDSLFAVSQGWAGQVVTILDVSSPTGYGRQSLDVGLEGGSIHHDVDANDLETLTAYDCDPVIYLGPSRANPEGISTHAGRFGPEAAKDILTLAAREGITITVASFRYRDAVKHA